MVHHKRLKLVCRTVSVHTHISAGSSVCSVRSSVVPWCPSFTLCHIKFAKTTVKTQLLSLSVSSPLFSALLPYHPLSASWDKWLLWDSVYMCVCVCVLPSMASMALSSLFSSSKRLSRSCSFSLWQVRKRNTHTHTSSSIC